MYYIIYNISIIYIYIYIYICIIYIYYIYIYIGFPTGVANMGGWGTPQNVMGQLKSKHGGSMGGA